MDFCLVRFDLNYLHKAYKTLLTALTDKYQKLISIPTYGTETQLRALVKHLRKTAKFASDFIKITQNTL